MNKNEYLYNGLLNDNDHDIICNVFVTNKIIFFEIYIFSLETFMMIFLCHVQSKYMLTLNHWLGPP